MPTYTIRDPDTGHTIKIRGDSPPTEAELTGIFRDANMNRPLSEPTEASWGVRARGAAQGMGDAARALVTGIPGAIKDTAMGTTGLLVRAGYESMAGKGPIDIATGISRDVVAGTVRGGIDTAREIASGDAQRSGRAGARLLMSAIPAGPRAAGMYRAPVGRGIQAAGKAGERVAKAAPAIGGITGGVSSLLRGDFLNAPWHAWAGERAGRILRKPLTKAAEGVQSLGRRVAGRPSPPSVSPTPAAASMPDTHPTPGLPTQSSAVGSTTSTPPQQPPPLSASVTKPQGPPQGPPAPATSNLESSLAQSLESELAARGANVSGQGPPVANPRGYAELPVSKSKGPGSDIPGAEGLLTIEDVKALGINPRMRILRVNPTNASRAAIEQQRAIRAARYRQRGEAERARFRNPDE